MVPRFFANQCKSSSHTRESVTDKASCSIGYGAKKIQARPEEEISTDESNDQSQVDAWAVWAKPVCDTWLHLRFCHTHHLFDIKSLFDRQCLELDRLQRQKKANRTMSGPSHLSFRNNSWDGKVVANYSLLGQLNAVVLARAVWMKFLGGRRIIYFIDHCVKGSSVDKMWRRVLAMFDADDSMAHTGAISIEHSRWSF